LAHRELHGGLASFVAGQNLILEQIASGNSLSEVLTELVELIESQTPGMVCSILLVDEDGLHLRHGAAPKLPEAYTKAIDGVPIGPTVGSCGTAAYFGKPIVVTDIETDPLWDGFRELAAKHGLRACWSNPIISRDGQVSGTFAMYYDVPRGPLPEEARLTEIAAHIASIAIDSRRSEELLRKSEERSRAILRAVPDSIFVLNSDFVYIECQPGKDCQLPVPPQYIIGKHISEVLPPDSAARLRSCLQRASESGEAQLLEYTRPFDGWTQYNEVRVSPTRDGQFLVLVRDITDRKLAERALEERQNELRTSNAKIHELAGKIMTAQEEERRRISRELHDDINQQVAALTIMISHIKRKSPEADCLKNELDWLRKHSVGLAESIRRMSHELHPNTLEHMGLAAALRTYVSELNSLENAQVRLTISDTVCAIPDKIAVCLYRIAQESLRNIIKHSGTHSADVALFVENKEVQLHIFDPGVGFDLAAARSNGGLGLASMEERVRLVQGTFTISSEPGRGTQVKATIPI
jgi:PAS domain S-box-containing protein